MIVWTLEDLQPKELHHVSVETFMISGLRIQFISLFDNLFHLVIMLIITTLDIFFINMTDVII